MIGERTGTSSQYFASLQKFCVMELGFSLVPVPSQREAGTFLAQMVCENADNCFKKCL